MTATVPVAPGDAVAVAPGDAVPVVPCEPDLVATARGNGGTAIPPGASPAPFAVTATATPTAVTATATPTAVTATATPTATVAARVGAAAVGDGGEEGDRVVVKVWQIPVRLIHWTLVATVAVLSVTGIYIANPALAPADQNVLIMAYIRAVHIGVGFVFIACLICRVIFAFSGNRYARWDQFIPIKPEYRRHIIPSFLFYTFRRREAPAVVGHNPLAGMTYVVLFLMFTVQSITGIALDAVDGRSGWMWVTTGWVFQIASIGVVRLAHHMIMWMTWGFVVHHVYSAILMDHMERSGLVSSMVSGYKSVPKGRA